MSEIVIKRNLSPKTRKDTSPYRIKLDNVGENDTLIVEIANERNGEVKKHIFLPGSIKGKKSIHFRDLGAKIYWLSGINPDRVVEVNKDISE